MITDQQLARAEPFEMGATRNHWILHLAEGLLLVGFGIVAVFMPFAVGIALVGWLFLFGGLAGLLTTLLRWQAPGFGWSLLSAISTSRSL